MRQSQSFEAFWYHRQHGHRCPQHPCQNVVDFCSPKSSWWSSFWYNYIVVLVCDNIVLVTRRGMLLGDAGSQRAHGIQLVFAGKILIYYPAIDAVLKYLLRALEYLPIEQVRRPPWCLHVVATARLLCCFCFHALTPRWVPLPV